LQKKTYKTRNTRLNGSGQLCYNRVYSNQRRSAAALEPVWTVIHLARSEQSAREILRFLQEESFLARFRRVSAGAQGRDCYEILVPSGEAGEAQQLLIENNLLR